MITDIETDFVYFSSLVKIVPKYEKFWNEFEKLLVQNNIKYGFIDNTKDIWCRDYMPVQISENEFIQFKYYPDYYLLPKLVSRLTIQNELKNEYSLRAKQSEHKIDGGNIVKSKNTAILTNKIYKDNSSISPETIDKELKELLKTENIFIIPVVAYDISGHSDGMVRFINDNQLFVADYSNESKSWKKEMDKAIKKIENSGIEIIPFPAYNCSEKNSDGDYTAKGVYINYLEIGNTVFLPQFNHEKDIEAVKIAKTYFSKVIPLNCNDIALEGGVLNCISWNIKLESEF